MDIALIGILSAAIVALLFVLLSKRPGDEHPEDAELPEHASDVAGQLTEQAKQPAKREAIPAKSSAEEVTEAPSPAYASAAETTTGGVAAATELDAADARLQTPDVAGEQTPDAQATGAAGEQTPDVQATGAAGEQTADSTGSDAEVEAAEAAPAQASEAAPAAEAPPAETRTSAFRRGLSTTRGGFISRLANLFKGRQEVDEDLLEQIEEVLITADIGVKTSDGILEHLREQQRAGKLTGEADLWKALKAQARGILNLGEGPLNLDTHRPSLLMVVGVNGVGKTTTIGKLASKYQSEGRRVLLAAGDTFRAAAVPQLEVWAQRVGCPVVKGKEGADPGSVLFDAVKQAEEGGYDLVIADTAGRLHTKQPLMEELKKLERTATKALGGREPDEILLVLDSTTGQNAVQQMYMFRDALRVSGVVLTKLDGTAKGGVILGIVDEHKVPVRFIGLGEKVEDLREFRAGDFVDALFDRPDGETMAA